MKTIKLLLLAVLLAAAVGSPADPVPEAFVLFNKGAVLYRSGRYAKAAEVFLKAASVYQKSKGYDRTKLGNMYGWAGYSYFMIKQYRQAVRNFSKAFQINRTIGRKDNMASYLYNIGSVYRAWKRYRKAIVHFRQGLAICRGQNKRGQYPAYLYSIGMVYSDWGKYDKAVRFLKAAVTAEKAAGRRTSLPTYYYYLGVASRLGKKLDAALAAMRNAVRTGRLQRRFLPTFLNGLGNVLKDMKKYSESVVAYRKAYRTARGRLGTRFLQVYLRNLVNGYTLLKKEKEATFYKEKLLPLVPAGRKAEREGLLIDITNFYMDRNRQVVRRKYLAKLIAFYRETKEPKKRAEMLYALGISWHKAGQFRKAIDNFQKVLPFLQVSGDVKQAAAVHNYIGMAFDSLKDYGSAVSHYSNAIAAPLKPEDNTNRASYLNNLGMTFVVMGNYSGALSCFKKALRLDLRRKVSTAICRDYLNIGQVYQTLGFQAKAFSAYQKGHIYAVQGKDGMQIGRSYVNLAQIRQIRGEYRKAHALLIKALPLFQRKKNADGMATVYNNRGELYREQGVYDRALASYEKALAINKKETLHSGELSCYNNMGLLYNDWGFYRRALHFFSKGKKLNRKLGNKEMAAILSNNSGLSFLHLKKYGKALRLFRRALRIDRQLGKRRSLAIRHNNIGLVQYSRGEYKRAIRSFRRALAIERKHGFRLKLSVYLKNIGRCFRLQRNYVKSLEYFRRALALDRRQGNLPGRIDCHGNIGMTLTLLGKYVEGVKALRRAVGLIERQRLTAPGKIRREYLASRMYFYRWLAAAYLRNGQVYRAFAVAEFSRAKYLSEQLRKKHWKRIASSIDIKRLLPKKTAVISYLDLDDTYTMQMVLTRKFASGAMVSKTELAFTPQLLGRAENAIAGLRGVKLVSLKKKTARPGLEKDPLSRAVTYYRSLLSRGQRNGSQMDDLGTMSSMLYGFLFRRLEKQLRGIDQLIIIPDGMLAFLPFEALAMPDGRYLVEKFSVKYSQSLQVLSIINERKYNQKRKPFLGYGGAIYKRRSYMQDMGDAASSMDAVRNTFQLLATRGAGTRKVYSMLGYTNWSNLPGSLAEIRTIGNVIRRADVHTGRTVSEGNLKKLSRQGILEQYRVLHFATHGLVVPQLPELSALVLSTPSGKSSREDGYLRMSEIARLRIKADFVNLSACETGLGKIYDGEGVVGLTQAFQVAGANALSVSLWQVADRSTMRLMVGMYSLVQKKKLTYLEAFRRMKLAFIQGRFGSRLADPFYWAPFVYYGR